MRDHRDEIPKDERAILREIDFLKINSQGFRLFPKRTERQKPVQTRVGKGGGKAGKILRRQR